MFNPRVNTTLYSKKVWNISVSFCRFWLYNVHFIGRCPATPSKFWNKFSFIWCGNTYKKNSVNVGNLRLAVTKISRVYSTKNLLGIKNILKKEEKDGKIIEWIAIGLRHLLVRRPKKNIPTHTKVTKLYQNVLKKNVLNFF